METRETTAKTPKGQKSVRLKQVSPEQINSLGLNTMMEALGIKMTEVGENYLKAIMPVDHRTKQPAGIMHGGASVALAETLGSIGASLLIDTTTHACVGLEINANHIRSCKDGFVEGIGRPQHVGKSTQIWEIKITQNDQLVCLSRITLMILRK